MEVVGYVKVVRRKSSCGRQKEREVCVVMTTIGDHVGFSGEENKEEQKSLLGLLPTRSGVEITLSKDLLFDGKTPRNLTVVISASASKTISKVAYDVSLRHLRLSFRVPLKQTEKNTKEPTEEQREYLYEGVPPSVVSELLAAKSIGSYVQHMIKKSSWKFKRIDINSKKT